MRNKGQFHTIEAAIAITAVLVVVFLVFRINAAPEIEAVSMKQKVLDSLKALDDGNRLRHNVLAGNNVTIENYLESYFPIYNFTVYFCPSVSCTPPVLTQEKVFSVSYFISGDMGNSKSYEVIVYVE